MRYLELGVHHRNVENTSQPITESEVWWGHGAFTEHLESWLTVVLLSIASLGHGVSCQLPASWPASCPVTHSFCPQREAECRRLEGRNLAILVQAWQHDCTFGGDLAGASLGPTARHPVYPGWYCNPLEVTCGPWPGQWPWQGKHTPYLPVLSQLALLRIWRELSDLSCEKFTFLNIHNFRHFQGVMDSTKLIDGPLEVWLCLPSQPHLNPTLTILQPFWTSVIFSECIFFFHSSISLHRIFTLSIIHLSSLPL